MCWKRKVACLFSLRELTFEVGVGGGGEEAKLLILFPEASCKMSKGQDVCGLKAFTVSSNTKHCPPGFSIRTNRDRGLLRSHVCCCQVAWDNSWNM